MAPLTWRRLGLTFALTAIAAWLGTRLWLGAGAQPMDVPWTVAAVCVVAAAMALVWGWTVRQYVRGDRPGLDALKAARIAVYAQACGLAGAATAGLFGGYALVWVAYWSHAPRREAAIAALVAALGGLALSLAGVVAERWCRYGGRDDDDNGDSTEIEAV